MRGTRQSFRISLIGWLFRGFGFLILLIIFYVSAAFLAAILPVSGRPQSAESHEPIYVCADEVHSDILIPLSDVAIDWQGKFDLDTLRQKYPNSYAAFGWGDLVFFRDVPTWGDVRPTMVASAFFGLHPTAIRVQIVKPPDAKSACKQIAVDAVGRQALAQHILESLNGKSAIISNNSRYEFFYPAKGRYGVFRTCNQWVADGLGKAGVPHAIFAPFSFGVMWPLQAPLSQAG